MQLGSFEYECKTDKLVQFSFGTCLVVIFFFLWWSTVHHSQSRCHFSCLWENSPVCSSGVLAAEGEGIREQPGNQKSQHYPHLVWCLWENPWSKPFLEQVWYPGAGGVLQRLWTVLLWVLQSALPSRFV